MGVGLDPKLTKWSVHSGPVNCLTGKGYKEHHWLVVPHQPLRLSSLRHLLLCLLIAAPPPLASFLVPSTNLESVGPLFVFTPRWGVVLFRTAP